jgi:hypothetical protein
MIERTVYVLMNFNHPMVVAFTLKGMMEAMQRDICDKAEYERLRREGVMRIVRSTLTIPRGSEP